MSRHRNVRALNYSDEYDGYDDVYGHSVEEETGISPSDAAQFLYRRDQRPAASYFQQEGDIEEEEEEGTAGETSGALERRESVDLRALRLTDEDEARLMSCLDELRNVLGDTHSDHLLISAVLENQYDFAKALDQLLNAKKVAPARIPSPDQTESIFDRSESNVKSKGAVVMTPRIVASIGEPKALSVVKGFKVDNGALSPTGPGTPRSQSPASGRATPSKLTESISTEEIRSTMRKENKLDPNVQYSNERGSEKEHVYMVVIGHVDAGKSTLMGRLLCELGEVSQRTLHKYEQESKKLGKQSFMYAWVLDETGEERARGITMDVGRAQFHTPSKKVTVLDAPGHADFIPNMIAGAGQADVALLVVDATRGEFESGFDLGGQTREHALLVRSLGVSQLAVAINKLDTAAWARDRYDEITNKLKSFLKQAGFRDSDVTFVPCSGLTGENLIKPASEAELIKWYNGPYLLQVIDGFKIPERPISKPLRISIDDIFKGTGSGFCVAGKIETGVVNKGDKVLVCPLKEMAEVKSIYINEMPCNVAFAGDQASLTLSGIDIQNVAVGNILSDPVYQVPITSRFEARIVVFNVKVPITKGFPVLLHHQSLIESAHIVKLKALLNKSTGEVVRRRPRCLGNNSVALVEVEASRPVCVERYKDIKELGRIMLRVAGVTIAAGLVTEIISKKSN